MQNFVKIDLMAPAGSYEALMAAIKAGAGSVYFGVGKLNMRARAAKTFQLDDLAKIADICAANNVRSYLALNTILYDHEMSDMQEICLAAKKAGISAVIATDMAAISYANEIGLEVHISTQANVSNLQSVKFFARYADVIVLARELTLEQITFICDEIKRQHICGPGGQLVQIELFVHGALCVSISGKCYMSLALTNHSANRGDCLQNCRRDYTVTDKSTGDELDIDNSYVMSPKDICTIGYMDKLIESGVSVFKIEGRGRPADYVYRVTKAYRQAINSYNEGSYTPEKIEAWTRELEGVFNRGFWHGGYYLGHKLGEWSGIYGSQTRKQKVFVGYVRNYFRKSHIAEIMIQNETMRVEDHVIVTGTTTGFAETTVSSMYVDDKPASEAARGQVVTIPFADRVRLNDKVYILVERPQKK